MCTKHKYDIFCRKRKAPKPPDIVIIPEPPSDIQPVSKGYWLFGGWDQPIDVAALSDSVVTGRVLCYSWSSLNPANGVYDWSGLDANVNAVIAAGKKYAIKIRVGVYAPLWLQAAGVAFDTFQEYEQVSLSGPLRSYTVPVFFQDEYKYYWKLFITELTNHIKATTTYLNALEYIGAPGIGRSSAEFRIPYLKDLSIGIDNPAKWASHGYTTQICYDTYKEFFTHLDNSLDNKKNIFYPLVPRRTPDMGDGRDVLQEVVLDLQRDKVRYYVQDTYITENFNGQTLDALAKQKGVPITGQLATIYFNNISTVEAQLGTAIDKFAAYPCYGVLEIYNSNVSDYNSMLNTKKPLLTA